MEKCLLNFHKDLHSILNTEQKREMREERKRKRINER